MPGEQSRKAEKFLTGLYKRNTAETANEKPSQEDAKKQKNLFRRMMRNRQKRARSDEMRGYLPHA